MVEKGAAGSGGQDNLWVELISQQGNWSDGFRLVAYVKDGGVSYGPKGLDSNIL